MSDMAGDMCAVGARVSQLERRLARLPADEIERLKRDAGKIIAARWQLPHPGEWDRAVRTEADLLQFEASERLMHILFADECVNPPKRVTQAQLESLLGDAGLIDVGPVMSVVPDHWNGPMSRLVRVGRTSADFRCVEAAADAVEKAAEKTAGYVAQFTAHHGRPPTAEDAWITWLQVPEIMTVWDGHQLPYRPTVAERRPSLLRSLAILVGVAAEIGGSLAEYAHAVRNGLPMAWPHVDLENKRAYYACRGLISAQLELRATDWWNGEPGQPMAGYYAHLLATGRHGRIMVELADLAA